MTHHKKYFHNRKKLMSYSQQEKKDDNLPLGSHLETRNNTGEENKQRYMPVSVDNHLADTLSGLEFQAQMQSLILLNPVLNSAEGLKRFLNRYPNYFINKYINDNKI